MVKLLEQAVSQLSLLPDDQQEALAALLLEEMASEHRWTESFAKSQGLLDSMAAEAVEEFRAGKTQPMDLGDDVTNHP